MKEVGHVNDYVFPMPKQGVPGLTKRELFAAMALQGLLSGRRDTSLERSVEVYPECAVMLADELIKELNK